MNHHTVTTIAVQVPPPPLPKIQAGKFDPGDTNISLSGLVEAEDAAAAERAERRLKSMELHKLTTAAEAQVVHARLEQQHAWIVVHAHATPAESNVSRNGC